MTETVHKSWSKNPNADALSRIGSVGKVKEQTDNPDENTRKQVLYEFHDARVGGHRGMNKTYPAIKSKYTWPKMRREVEDYVKLCSCQINTILTPKHKAPMEITTAERPFVKCYLDVVGPLPVTLESNTYKMT